MICRICCKRIRDGQPSVTDDRGRHIHGGCALPLPVKSAAYLLLEKLAREADND